MHDIDEPEALRRLKRGEIDALEPLARLPRARAVRAAYFVTRDRGQAEEVVQASWLRAFDRIDQFDIVRPFAPWFFRIVLSQAGSAVARARREVPLDQPGDSAANDASPEALVEQAETADQVWMALGRQGDVRVVAS